MKKFFTAFSFLFTSIAASAQYCVPAPGTDGCTDGDMIDNFILFGENNTSIINILTGCSAGAYADLTAQSVSLGQGTGYVATISTQYVPDDNVAIWIDFNNNDVFELTELIGLQTNISLTGSPVPLVIPGTAPLGPHRMRVSLRYDVAPIDQDPCNTGINASDFGEAHDYTVNVVAAPTCATPGTVTISNVTSSGATVTWSGTASLYSIEYGPAGFTPGTGTYSTTSSTTENLGGLNANTGYSVYVRALCSTSDSSTISSAMFTTLCAPINVPYTENFDGVITPDIPACMTVEDVNNDQTTWMTDSYIASSLPNAMH
ncbi:MAG TPA: fibronectin type III domain-containing protein, partial [Flavipsychrobacter sp.]|nr:fibronectin type III domain-containing protein [Flavipsychrobacter sp.]